MLLPVLLLVGVGLWAQSRPVPVAPQPTPTPGPLRLEITEFKKVTLTPYDVSRGADTKVRIKVVTLGAPNVLQKGLWNWNSALTVRSLATAKAIHDDVGRLSGKQILLGGGGGGIGDAPAKDLYFTSTQLLRLRDIPIDKGALELRWDWVFGPQPTIPSQQYPSLEEITNLAKKVPSALSTRATMKVRRAGQTIKKPVVSTDTLFDVRNVKITPSKAAIRSGPVKVVVDAFYRGPKETKWNLPTTEIWKLSARNGTPFGQSYAQGLFKVTGAQRRGELARDFDFSSQKDEMKNKPLLLRAIVSIDGAWPKIVEIPIP